MHGDSNCLSDAAFIPVVSLDPEPNGSRMSTSDERNVEFPIQTGRRPRSRHRRFLRALELYEKGLQPADIAAELNCTPGEVMRLLELGQLSGFQEATSHHRPGRAKLLDARANEFLASLLRSDPRSRGHRAKRWTIPLLREELIHAGYTASDSTVWRAARRLGWSHRRQTPPDNERFDDWSSRPAPHNTDPGRSNSIETDD